MIKNPNFQDRVKFGASSGKSYIPIEEIKVTVGAVVHTRYEDKFTSIRVTKVIEPQSIFEGMIESFENDPEHAGLKQGETVRFTYDKIQHIYKWVEEDQ